ncbi:patatin-like phospholipase family protein [Spirillospora sp. NBC_01491]|uniref:patatin-like phospholipase family protein n=1 Tax=Spirillospora sp. NBC_01491 TaxID=2976007 RepID=UPI002E2F8F31|nr:patatin-like phospholipase family protein [Spirillospora sp. NBC_01491]
MHAWPDRRLLIVGVNAETGEPRVFDRESGVPLVDVVSASCAVPGIWPPVSIDGVRYVDGGVRTSTNLDLAAGCARVLVLAPMVDPGLEEDVARLASAGGRVEVITPDEASLSAFGDDPLAPSTRTPSAVAGRAQGLRAADRVAELWA